MRRSLGRRGRLQSGQNLFPQVLGLSAGRPFFTASNYTVDGVSGKVSAFVDWSDPSRKLVQATSANQVAIPAGHSDFGGALCATFDSAGPSDYLSNTADITDYMHDGNGGEVFVVCSMVGAMIGAICGSRNTSGRGFSLLAYSVYSRVESYVVTAADALVISLASTTHPAPGYVNFSYATTSTPDATLRIRSTSEATGNELTSPESGASSQSLRIGTDGLNPLSMRWHSMMFFPVLSTSERTLVQRWILAETGLAP